jgi:hypothetical protein
MALDDLRAYLVEVMGNVPDADLQWTFDELREIRAMRDGIEAGDDGLVDDLLRKLVRQYWLHVPGFAAMFEASS